MSFNIRCVSSWYRYHDLTLLLDQLTAPGTSEVCSKCSSLPQNETEESFSKPGVKKKDERSNNTPAVRWSFYLLVLGMLARSQRLWCYPKHVRPRRHCAAPSEGFKTANPLHSTTFINNPSAPKGRANECTQINIPEKMENKPPRPTPSVSAWPIDSCKTKQRTCYFERVKICFHLFDTR